MECCISGGGSGANVELLFTGCRLSVVQDAQLESRCGVMCVSMTLHKEMVKMVSLCCFLLQQNYY